jgi:hypothetical protein
MVEQGSIRGSILRGGLQPPNGRLKIMVRIYFAHLQQGESSIFLPKLLKIGWQFVAQ